jgi:hypothetical protein
MERDFKVKIVLPKVKFQEIKEQQIISVPKINKVFKQ